MLAMGGSRGGPGFSLVELLVVLSIIAILASMSVQSYINYTNKAKVASYALPIARACMADVASACSAGSPIPANPVGNSSFPNCQATRTVAVGTVNLSTEENFNCSNDGSLSSGVIKARIVGVGSYSAVCRVSVKPFQCKIEAN